VKNVARKQKESSAKEKKTTEGNREVPPLQKRVFITCSTAAEQIISAHSGRTLKNGNRGESERKGRVSLGAGEKGGDPQSNAPEEHYTNVAQLRLLGKEKEPRSD